MENVPFLPPAPRLTRFCACGEPLTLEMEFDQGVCVDCMADMAKLHEPQERISA